MTPTHLLLVCIVVYILSRALYTAIRRTRRLRFLRGPESPSFWLGHEFALSHQAEVCSLETSWSREYGTALRIAGCVGTPTLVLTDPLALRHVLHGSGPVSGSGYREESSGYRYPKPRYFQLGNQRLFGRGILWAEGSVHKRHRKALNPAFSSSQLKQFLGLFERKTRKLIQKWDEELLNVGNDENEGGKGQGKIIDVTKWFPRVTLDIIGESAFNYKFGAIDGSDSGTNELLEALKNIFIDSRARTPADILFHEWRLGLPSWVTRVLGLRTPEDRRFSTYLETSKRCARQVLERANNEGVERAEGNDLEEGGKGKHKKCAGGDKMNGLGSRSPLHVTKMNGKENGKAKANGKDVLSVLVQSNNAEDPKKRLDDDEVLSQISTMILVGHETTAMTLSWLLYEIARHPEDQRRMRQEITSVKERVRVRVREGQVGNGGEVRGPGRTREGANGRVPNHEEKNLCDETITSMTSNDYDSMHYFNDCIKETLRLYPVAPIIIREASEDDVIPLLHPVLSSANPSSSDSEGTLITQIPVEKGQKVHIPITVYNSLPSVFGKDAHEWNPSRFENLRNLKSLNPNSSNSNQKLQGPGHANGTGEDVNLGFLSNLLTFSSGVRGCIGWQFAVMELQTILFGLIESYEFSLPPEGLDIQQVPAGTTSPMVRGQLEKGIQMPLVVRRIRKEEVGARS